MKDKNIEPEERLSPNRQNCQTSHINKNNVCLFFVKIKKSTIIIKNIIGIKKLGTLSIR